MACLQDCSFCSDLLVSHLSMCDDIILTLTMLPVTLLLVQS